MRKKALTLTLLSLVMVFSVGCGKRGVSSNVTNNITPPIEEPVKNDEVEPETPDDSDKGEDLPAKAPVEGPGETTENPDKPVSNEDAREIPQELAEKYKLFTEKYDNNVLIGLSAKDILQLYIKATWEKDYKTEYHLFHIPEESDAYTLDMHLAIPESERGGREAIEANLVPSLDGEFTDNGDNTGFVLYHIDGDKDEDEIRLDMAKDDDGVWKIYYNPNVG